MKSPRLFTYIVRYDDGAAPNPFGGICSLAICKPKIRSVAEIGDWVAGVGGSNAPSGRMNHRLVYAMRVEEVISLAKYDERAPSEWPKKVPDLASLELADRLGDCIYDFSASEVRQRPGVHGKINQNVDLGGRNVLLSKDFYYFGRNARLLPHHLRCICPVTQGHRSDANKDHVDSFVTWLRGLNLPHGQIHGWPDMVLNWSDIKVCGGCAPRAVDDDQEERGIC
jgi:hypothetical protein